MKKPYNFDTNAIHVSESPNLSGETSSDVVAPIHLSSTFAKPNFTDTIKGHGYSRLSNPTREVMESKLNTLESAKHTICYASGQAAESAVILSYLKSGDEIICFDDIYGGTRRLLAGVFDRFNIKTHFVDMRDLKNVENAINKNTKMLWAESPTNPFLTLCDIEKLAKIAKKHKILSVIDNTFATPYIQKPLEMGIDIVVHSMTKYINGHSDSIAGAVCVGSESLYEPLRYVSNSTGMVLSPMDSYLNIRGVKTLGVRMERHCSNAMEVAKFLESHPKVERVFYPGLKSFPQFELAKKQMKGGFGGMVSVYLKADSKGMQKFAKNLELFTLAESLGGVESLYGAPFYMSHGSVDAEIKKQMNITENLLRLSIGLENANDLKTALDNALKVI
ncbi:aminotransferase class I/II-fold pyridoxal phosphate-dependent enzyme [Helicobacter saguini]|uniref:Aminotransferase class I/II-fold pyridoxal phosphate-dependent enzyme n=1 Tax=Helicobacter saguini TaxID=1548018 RepID=A0A347VTW2_9HELI|nr:aminotransferase class I/II-fold pyridoxal phosphate-dependent enzyme [Helicobacter saguini]MWV61439.1 aminotransferase class I/II-fold pyridoxal phosphate-dependent enzyme [Helicobacter saguini]MWV67891.1 aminotransferase class I/II-fold pyridoxal phosphate-dependent enzyme [Helicobacter saguini]MWV70641.1 aminotransferase class I/II-fold pyridoxal phosphate-dependent enzyme [Helicobacter saguini]MWV72545.1 aminotransferase class I/II-fold pyridoxal phosphate-dependent enzyme [Helicobacter 